MPTMSQSCTPNRPRAIHGDVSSPKDKDTKGATRINDCNEWSKIMWLLCVFILAAICIGIVTLCIGVFEGFYGGPD